MFVDDNWGYRIIYLLRLNFTSQYYYFNFHQFRVLIYEDYRRKFGEIWFHSSLFSISDFRNFIYLATGYYCPQQVYFKYFAHLRFQSLGRLVALAVPVHSYVW